MKVKALLEKAKNRYPRYNVSLRPGHCSEHSIVVSGVPPRKVVSVYEFMGNLMCKQDDHDDVSFMVLDDKEDE